MTTTTPLDGQATSDVHTSGAVEGPILRSGQVMVDAQVGPAAADLPPRPDMAASMPISQALGGDPLPEWAIPSPAPTRPAPARGTTPSAPATAPPAPMGAAPVLADPALALAADVVDDLERVRIANENRLRQLTRDVEDSDGETRGFGLPVEHPDVARLAGIVEGLAKLEHDAVLELQRKLRKHPLGPWVKATRGIGEKQGARLLAAIGDPYWNTLYDRPRTVSELWAYTGYHVQDGAAVGRARGQKANWSATAKMRAYLIAESCVKSGGPLREVYDEARAKYDGALHETECRRCGPSGKPAQPGSPISAGHQHARALRAVSKEVLRLLWLEARRLHGVPD